MKSTRLTKHEERLHTTDENGDRVYVYPDEVDGIWRNRRSHVYNFLLLVFILAPWIKINGQPLILLNILERKFSFFGFVFWGHDAPLLLFLILGFIVVFGIFTSLFGRVWCGWMCPQTVFIDRIFRKIETFVEGKGRKREKLDQSELSFEKIWKKSLKWFFYFLASIFLAHTFLSYFVGAYDLLGYLLLPPSQHWEAFVAMSVFSIIILFDFGWFKEQFCIILCPYGRIQSVMMDEQSRVVGYDFKRGEPRKQNSKDFHGDCVNCFQCVSVCPTGIDIRRGLQMECIACTACIDACDNIMTRLNKPKGLIRYTSEIELAGERSSKFRPRVTIYALALLLISTLSIFQFNEAQNLRAVMLKAGRTPYKIVKDLNGKEEILNHFKLEMFYKGDVSKKISFLIENNKGKVDLVTPQNPYLLKKGRKKTAHIFFRFDRKQLDKGQMNIVFNVNENKKTIYRKELILVGPYL